MYALIGLAAFLAVIGLAVNRGWGADTRDPEFTLAVSAFGHSGAGWTSARRVLRPFRR